jgi:hypothetical protein
MMSAPRRIGDAERGPIEMPHHDQIHPSKCPEPPG